MPRMIEPQIAWMTWKGPSLRSTCLPSASTVVKHPRDPRSAGFTFVELIVVMALLALMAGLAAPSLSRSLRQRKVDEEATRFIALTEYARDEAVSQGIPMVVWVDQKGQRCGVEPKEGFEGDVSRDREFAMNPDVSFKIDNAATSGGVTHAVEFAPDGSPGLSSVELVELTDRFDSALSIVRTEDRWSYEIVKEGR